MNGWDTLVVMWILGLCGPVIVLAVVIGTWIRAHSAAGQKRRSLSPRRSSNHQALLPTKNEPSTDGLTSNIGADNGPPSWPQYRTEPDS